MDFLLPVLNAHKELPKLAALPFPAQCYTGIPCPLHANTPLRHVARSNLTLKSMCISVCSELVFDYATLRSEDPFALSCT